MHNTLDLLVVDDHAVMREGLKRILETCSGVAVHISPKTVTTYRTRIIEKTGLANNAELTRYMLENNLLD